jgi:hypothetical protein
VMVVLLATRPSSIRQILSDATMQLYAKIKIEKRAPRLFFSVPWSKSPSLNGRAFI